MASFGDSLFGYSFFGPSDTILRIESFKWDILIVPKIIIPQQPTISSIDHWPNSPVINTIDKRGS